MATTTTRGGLTKPADGEAADIVVINANMDKISLNAMGAFICTSVTRPASPWTGQLIYETDTKLIQAWGPGWIPVTTLLTATSTTRPAGIGWGTYIFETDTLRTLVWRGAWQVVAEDPSYITFDVFNTVNVYTTGNVVVKGFVAVPQVTRVYIECSAQAGGPNAVDAGLTVTSAPVVAYPGIPAVPGVNILAAKRATVNLFGYVDIPANTSMTINLVCSATAAQPVTFTGGVKWTRTSI